MCNEASKLIWIWNWNISNYTKCFFKITKYIAKSTAVTVDIEIPKFL